MSKEITTEMLLDMIEKTGWDISSRDTIVRVDIIAHNMELQQKVKVLEKALELACKECLSFPCSEYCSSRDECADCYYKEKYTPEKFKTKAKEMMKSE